MDCTTLAYKSIGDQQILLDIYLPSQCHLQSSHHWQSSKGLPTIVYFHAGGLMAGTRATWIPVWLFNRALTRGYAVLSADYRLLVPCTGHQILEDVRDLFTFVSKDLNRILFSSSKDGRRIDPESIVVAGSSGGAFCAYLAAIHANPKPKGVLSIYGMGGDVMCPHYLTEKTSPFFHGRPLMDPTEWSEFLHPISPGLPWTSAQPIAYAPQDSADPGCPIYPRMLVPRLYLQLGTFLDYFTGEHEPNISGRLRQALEGSYDSPISPEKLRPLVPKQHLPIFPQVNLSSSFPPTFLIHGEADSAVPVRESRNMYESLKRLAVMVELRLISGKEHSFDYKPGAEAEHSVVFNEAINFIDRCFT
ncbi:alpha/beta-hydrolase [Rickenella mellea]|uniref:Alpha/beta-hydrolase n=1 Tax=Rickenella mellea TaxID=50990 RepID=A0A4Y7Q4R3_9AGAM|nr:alpha/beta-hydrolase [Rickenella mellea]